MDWILLAVGGAVAALGFPLGKALFDKLSLEKINAKHWALEHATIILIRYAEKYFKGSGRGREKLEYVISRLEDKFPWASSLKLEEFVEGLLEGALEGVGNGESSPSEQ